MIGESARLVAIVRDVEDRHRQLVPHALEVGQDATPQLEVDGRQRLVEEQHVGRRHQRPGQRDALPLPS